MTHVSLVILKHHLSLFEDRDSRLKNSNQSSSSSLPKDLEEVDKANFYFASGKTLSISNFVKVDSSINDTEVDSENSSSFSLTNNSCSYKSPCRNDVNKSARHESSVSPPTWRQRHTNSFQRTLRRFHSAFMVKNILSNESNKTSANGSNKSIKVNIFLLLLFSLGSIRNSN